MFKFSNLVNSRLSFLLLSISAVILSNTINILCSLFGLYYSISLYHVYHLSIEQKLYNQLNILSLHFLTCKKTIDTLSEDPYVVR